MTNRAIAQARLRNAALVGPPLGGPREVVGWFGAVQSQDVPGALWGIAQRLDRTGGASSTIAALGAAMDDGRIVRTHALRPTWHFLVPDDLRWIQALTAPRVHRANGTMYRRLDLDDEAFARADEVFRAALAGGRALTREELADAVGRTGIRLADTLVITHLAMHAELDARIVSGPRRGKQSTYQLVDERIRPGLPAPDDTLRELTVRYFRSHGPALVQDYAWWSGLTIAQCRDGLGRAGSALEHRRVDGKDYWAAAGRFDPQPGLVPDGHVLLLPNYDETLGSYRDYDPVIDDRLPRARNVADVLGGHIVVREGLVVGVWRRALGPKRVTVSVTLLAPFSRAELDALAAEAERFGAFLELPVELRLERPA
jgi:hypothetical protein